LAEEKPQGLMALRKVFYGFATAQKTNMLRATKQTQLLVTIALLTGISTER
jgi:hypothetical protein